jgi:hypothetical protein
MFNLTPFTPSPGRPLPGIPGKWDSEKGWTDRDGVPLPATPMLVVFMDTLLRSWQNHHPVDHTAHPLPNVEELNSTIPRPWALGLDGKEQPPFALHWGISVFDPTAGQIHAFLNKTAGQRIMYETLSEQILVTQMFRGTNVAPVVMLEQRPMKTKVGMKSRPHMRVIDWKIIGGGESGTLPLHTPPLLGGSPSASTPTPTTGAPATSATTAAAVPALDPVASAASATASPAPVTNAASTLDQTKSVNPVTMSEFISDELPPGT